MDEARTALPRRRRRNWSPAALGGPTIKLVRFQTETGSIYEVVRDDKGMRWRRLSATFASGQLRSEEGVLTAWPRFALGARCALRSKPINPPWPRVVRTSWIVAFLQVEVESRPEVETERSAEVTA
jgi:hypothetical protein